MKPYEFAGRAWLITGNVNGKLIPDIDTDQIFHNAYLHITDIDQMGQYTFGNLEGWQDFAKKARPGDIVIAGSNFGAGSSRQQAVDCFKSLGIKVIIAVSFGAIYKRNAINSGLPILTFKDAEKVLAEKRIHNLNLVRVNLLPGEIINLETGEGFTLTGFSQVQKDIYDHDTLLDI